MSGWPARGSSASACRNDQGEEVHMEEVFSRADRIDDALGIYIATD